MPRLTRLPASAARKLGLGSTRSKFNVAPVKDRTYEGRVYASKAEAKYAAQLDLRKKVGDISGWWPQVPFRLCVNGVKLGTHYVDFSILDKRGEKRYVEVKGLDTPLGRLKRQLCEALYNIIIQVVWAKDI